MTSIEVMAGVVVLIAVYQLWVSILIFRAEQYEPRQKALQILGVWLAPVIGAAVAHSMLRAEGKPPYKPEKGWTDPGDSASP